jgi:hypothetical protein
MKKPMKIQIATKELSTIVELMTPKPLERTKSTDELTPKTPGLQDDNGEFIQTKK